MAVSDFPFLCEPQLHLIHFILLQKDISQKKRNSSWSKLCQLTDAISFSVLFILYVISLVWLAAWPHDRILLYTLFDYNVLSNGRGVQSVLWLVDSIGSGCMLEWLLRLIFNLNSSSVKVKSTKDAKLQIFQLPFHIPTSKSPLMHIFITLF